MREVDFIVVGGSPSGLSLAIDAADAGLGQVVIVDSDDESCVAPPSHPQLEVVTGEATISTSNGKVTIEVVDQVLAARAAAVVDEKVEAGPHLAVPEEVAHKLHVDRVPDNAWGTHVLVVGGSERAARLTIEISEQGANVVLARSNTSPAQLSRLTHSALLLKEAERRVTVLWHSRPLEITAIEDEPLVTFDDVQTPDLLFHHVVLVDDSSSTASTQTGPVWVVGANGGLAPGEAWDEIRSVAFPKTEAVPARSATVAETEELRDRHYNATITHFHRTHSDLWLIRVQPDQGDVSYRAGQYASLGLGYWEPRVDGARDRDLDRKWPKMVRRSYSISSPIFDDDRYLHDPARSSDLEFYIVLVPPTGDHIPGLTPRLALCAPGDRIYVGPRIVGRYTLDPVRDPGTTVLLLGTGTGEAPHNAMAAELLRRGHHGPIVSVVCVRYRADLAYLETHRDLEERFSNYHYLPLVTREPDTEKLYIQDVIAGDLLADRFGVDLDPSNTHAFLCGNPAMIGLPKWDEDRPDFPETTGVCELLAGRGFALDRHGFVGNVHSEKYW